MAFLILAAIAAIGFVAVDERTSSAADLSFGEDVQFLSEHVDTIVLGNDPAGPRIAVVPAYQGRVMTSTACGDSGTSFGWINYDHIRSGEIAPHINSYGGEERFWLGPEGGQYAIFFAPGAKFEFSDWQTPPLIDTEPFQVDKKSEKQARFVRDAELTNYSGTKFKIRIERDVKLMSNDDMEDVLGITLGDIKTVGYETRNRLTNTGDQDWSKEKGLLSIWLLGMYKHGPKTTVVIPFRKGEVSELGPIVNDEYFGKVPAERLKIGDGVLFFCGDGRYRSKIGLGPRRATQLCGSYDAARNVLTCLQYSQPGPEVTDYVNSMWMHQEEPYGGDVINSYNDGPPAPGAKPLGPFYELETSSPALALKQGESGQHVQRTCHFEGSRAQLDALARELFGVSLDQIESALK
ncbi:MAG: hypothetical protein JW829_01190 [Pirellulales bacterium]|nr:hypothetical protein [Pirellulales bacterium]